jgi:hypothetical protein
LFGAVGTIKAKDSRTSGEEIKGKRHIDLHSVLVAVAFISIILDIQRTAVASSCGVPSSKLFVTPFTMSCMKFHSHDHAEHIPPASQGKILFKNCTIFDGINEQLATGQDVLVEKNLISKIVPTGSTSFDNIDTILDCEGRTLIPGLIDCHWHSVVAALDMASLMNSDMTYIGIVAGCAAKETLLRGFTSCRDLGGATFGLKKATDNGTIEGPRLYPCGGECFIGFAIVCM